MVTEALFIGGHIGVERCQFDDESKGGKMDGSV